MPKPPLDLRTFGGRLELLMRERKITALALAAKTKVSDSSIAEYIHQRRLPNSDAVVRLADFFGVSTDWLLCRTNERGGFPEPGASP